MGLRVAAAQKAMENPGSTIFLMILGVILVIVFQYLLWRGLIGYGLCWVINGGDYSFSDDFKFWPFLPICNIKCEKEQCSNNGTGEVSGMIYGDCNCSCDTGYSGDKCQTSVSAPNPPAPGEPPTTPPPSNLPPPIAAAPQPPPPPPGTPPPPPSPPPIPTPPCAPGSGLIQKDSKLTWAHDGCLRIKNSGGCNNSFEKMGDNYYMCQWRTGDASTPASCIIKPDQCLPEFERETGIPYCTDTEWQPGENLGASFDSGTDEILVLPYCYCRPWHSGANHVSKAESRCLLNDPNVTIVPNMPDWMNAGRPSNVAQRNNL